MTETLETPASKIVPRLKTKYADSIKNTLMRNSSTRTSTRFPAW